MHIKNRLLAMGLPIYYYYNYVYKLAKLRIKRNLYSDVCCMNNLEHHIPKYYSYHVYEAKEA